MEQHHHQCLMYMMIMIIIAQQLLLKKTNEVTVASLTTMNLNSHAAGSLNMHNEEDYEIINSQTR